MIELRNTTLVFLVKKDAGLITDICLAMKKRGFGVGRYNGVGGKVEMGETIEVAALREAREEIAIEAKRLEKVGELSFYFPHNPAWDQLVHVYLTDLWKGEPKESEEMNPSWFNISDIPYSSMWPDDEFWIPIVIGGEKVRASFTFGEGDVVLEDQVEVVQSFEQPRNFFHTEATEG